jgi:hypothetical protein
LQIQILSKVIVHAVWHPCIPHYTDGMDKHAHVRRPKELIQEAKNRRRRDNRLLYYNDIVLEWITNHVLASVILFDIALIVPLLTLNAPDTVKITLGVISGSWIQWWALPALQRSQNKTQAQNEAKAEVDHETLTILPNCRMNRWRNLKALRKFCVISRINNQISFNRLYVCLARRARERDRSTGRGICRTALCEP